MYFPNCAACASSTFLNASLTDVKIKSCNISTSSGSTTSLSKVIDLRTAVEIDEKPNTKIDNIKYLHIPNGATLESMYLSIQKTNLYNYSVGVGNKNLTCDGNLIIGNNNIIISGLKAVVPEGIETIAASAFIGSHTREIKLPKSLKTINNAAFQSCSNATILIIGDNVTTIGTNVFSGCNKMP